MNRNAICCLSSWKRHAGVGEKSQAAFRARSKHGLFTGYVQMRAETCLTVLCHCMDIPAFAVLKVDEDAHRYMVRCRSWISQRLLQS